MAKWKIEDSEDLYNISGWGAGYFGINKAGHICVTPRKDGKEVDIRKLVDRLVAQGVHTPMLLRFTDIIAGRILKTEQCFQKATREYGYRGEHYIVYPIKVNQMRPVVDEIMSHGKRYNVGLEVGSKPELHAVLGTNMDTDSIIICNGHKDSHYIRLALLAQKMGKRIFIVVEKFVELPIIVETAAELGIEPNIGIRIKLASTGAGKWEESGGDASKFGLNSHDLLHALAFLREHGKQGCLRFIHFHIGSQITNIRHIQAALREASQFYVQLHAMGFPVRFVDCGGGLGVDYDGTRSANSDSSVNYSIQEYINDCVDTFVEVADKNRIPHPDIITESGRSLTAHHSILIMRAFETISQPQLEETWEAQPSDHKLVRELSEIWDHLTLRSMLEDWHDAGQIREEGLDLFAHGLIDLRTRAQIESLYWSITREAATMARGRKHLPEELFQLDHLLADKYYCNFSLFESLPDAWGIDQIFPIMPLQRLDEKPDRVGTIQDITCDSDGQITTYVSRARQLSYLPLHPLRDDGEPYYIAVFLVGAYQEILGNQHNLFGNTNAVHISLDDEGNCSIDKVIDGETVADVLNYVQFDHRQLLRRMRGWAARAVESGAISPAESQELLSNFEEGLKGYTYLTDGLF